MMIYKILRGPEYEALRAEGASTGSPDDIRDGFVHFSTREQLSETLRRHFSGAADLWLLGVDAEALGQALRWEPSRGGALFPHLYRALRQDEISLARPLSSEGFDLGDLP